MTNFRLFQTEESADNNYEFDENGRKFSRGVENTVGKGKMLIRAISPFTVVFSTDLYSRHVKTRACLEKGKGNQFIIKS